MEKYTKNANELSRDFVLRVLKNKIINVEMEPGSLISESEISKELGVSRTPVREALIELSRSKLVEIYPQKGSYISKIDYNIIDDVRYLRYIVETAIIELVCEQRTEEDILKLEEFVLLQEFYMKRDQPEVTFNYDNQFHSMLYTIVGKQMLESIVDNMNIHFDRVRKLSFQSQKDPNIIKDHLELIQAIKNRDKEKAKEILTGHLLRYKVDEELIKKKYADWIKD